MQAKDIMRKRVITVTQEMTIRELAKLFIDRGISGAPVVDASGRLLGVVSQTDLVRREREAFPHAEVPSFYQHSERAVYTQGFQIEDPDRATVRDVMTPAVLSADEATPVEEVAKVMLDKHIHRVVITRGGKLAGIVTSLDLLRALLAAGAPRRKERAMP